MCEILVRVYPREPDLGGVMSTTAMHNKNGIL